MPAMIMMIHRAKSVVLCPSAVYLYKNRETSVMNDKLTDETATMRYRENRALARKMRYLIYQKIGIKDQKWQKRFVRIGQKLFRSGRLIKKQMMKKMEQ
jgi:hypothetical protein